MRRCTKCGRDLSLGAFGRSRNGPAGLNYWCKACVRESAQRNRAAVVAAIGKDEQLRRRRALYLAHKVETNRKRAVRQRLRREHFNAQALAWRREHQESVSASKRAYRLKHAEKVKAYTRHYHQTHKRERNAHLRERKQVDPAFKLRERLRSTFADKLRKAIVSDCSPRRSGVMRYLGCTVQQLMIHLEAQFKAGMSWANWGRGQGHWHVDHIRPISSFDLAEESGLQACWHYSNLQPLWSEENLRKGGARRPRPGS